MGYVIGFFIVIAILIGIIMLIFDYWTISILVVACIMLIVVAVMNSEEDKSKRSSE
jgi:protein-S-isoprenylcysteine O-methyltransferase Ste14